MRDLRQASAEGRIRVVARRQPEAVPGEFRGEVKSPALARPFRSLFEQRRDPRVGVVRRESEVARPHVGIGPLARQPCVQRAACERGHPVVHDGADERVREPHLEVLPHDEQALLVRVCEQPVDVRLGQGVPQRAHRRPPERGGGLEQRGKLGRNGLEPPGNRGLQRVRKREPVRSVLGYPAAHDGAGQLHRVERVSTRDLVDPPQRRTRDRADRARKDVAELAQGERAELEHLAPVEGERAGNVQRLVLTRAEPCCREQTDALVFESAQGIAECACGSRVQPLRVVDRHDDGPALGKSP